MFKEFFTKSNPLSTSRVGLLNQNLNMMTVKEDKVLGAMLRGEKEICRHFLAELHWLNDNIRENSVVLDAGGNIGTVAIALATANPSSQFVAFEPDPLNFAFFQINLYLNNCSNVRGFNLALGSESSWIPMFLSPDNFGDHRTAIPKGKSLNEWDFAKSSHAVSKIKASEFITSVLQLDPPDVVKIDTQGADFEILADLTDSLGNDVKVGIEFSPYHLATNNTTWSMISGTLKKYKNIFEIQPGDRAKYVLVPKTIVELEEYFQCGKDEYGGYYDLALTGKK